ncbi:hypothetical protein [Streptomyces sp. NRRL WC-3742]|uniref:hypothetical protein n=1 Tax=Streptomyces sp. NRRL WC-3742 TaxID=1463934 RepID=UPI0004C9F63B|nr:hypothetical protein [Streptomyces sp. NRRL WC-3742]
MCADLEASRCATDPGGRRPCQGDAALEAETEAATEDGGGFVYPLVASGLRVDVRLELALRVDTLIAAHAGSSVG